LGNQLGIQPVFRQGQTYTYSMDTNSKEVASSVDKNALTPARTGGGKGHKEMAASKGQSCLPSSVGAPNQKGLVGERKLGRSAPKKSNHAKLITHNKWSDTKVGVSKEPRSSTGREAGSKTGGATGSVVPETKTEKPLDVQASSTISVVGDGKPKTSAKAARNKRHNEKTHARRDSAKKEEAAPGTFCEFDVVPDDSILELRKHMRETGNKLQRALRLANKAKRQASRMPAPKTPQQKPVELVVDADQAEEPLVTDPTTEATEGELSRIQLVTESRPEVAKSVPVEVDVDSFEWRKRGFRLREADSLPVARPRVVPEPEILEPAVLERRDVKLDTKDERDTLPRARLPWTPPIRADVKLLVKDERDTLPRARPNKMCHGTQTVDDILNHDEISVQTDFAAPQPTDVIMTPTKYKEVLVKDKVLEPAGEKAKPVESATKSKGTKSQSYTMSVRPAWYHRYIPGFVKHESKFDVDKKINHTIGRLFDVKEKEPETKKGVVVADELVIDELYCHLRVQKHYSYPSRELCVEHLRKVGLKWSEVEKFELDTPALVNRFLITVQKAVDQVDNTFLLIEESQLFSRNAGNPLSRPKTKRFNAEEDPKSPFYVTHVGVKRS